MIARKKTNSIIALSLSLTIPIIVFMHHCLISFNYVFKSLSVIDSF